MVEVTLTTLSFGRISLPLEENQPVSFWVLTCQVDVGVPLIVGCKDHNQITIRLSTSVLNTKMKYYVFKLWYSILNCTNQACE